LIEEGAVERNAVPHDIGKLIVIFVKRGLSASVRA
jgi:hypothetical protein